MLMNRPAIVLIAAVCVVVTGHAQQPGAPNVIYVDASAAPGGDGVSWASAYVHLQDGLADDPGAPREIRVAQGVYRPDRSAQSPNGTGDRTATFLLADDTSILGGYAGLRGDDPNARNPARFPSVLSGDLSGDDKPGDPATTEENSYHVVESWSNDATAVLDGFIVRGGRANRPIEQWDYTKRRDDSGAGALVVLSEAVFQSCTFENNQADANAHVFIALSGPFTAVEAGAGAVLAVRGEPTFTDCVFDNNRANRTGGAFGLYFAGATLERCEFTGNIVGLPGFGDSSHGAAVFDATNTAGAGPRAAYIACRFIANGAGTHAATHSWASTSDFINCLWLANMGGGLKIDNGFTVRLVNCAVVGNSGPGVFECAEIFNPVLLYNTIAWANQSGLPNANPNLVSLSSSFGVYDSIIGEIDALPIGAFDSDNLYLDDPQFADPIGPDGVAWSGDEDVRPIAGAFANDRGNNAHLALEDLKPGAIKVDADGHVRRADDPLAPDEGVGESPIVDIGPFERVPCAGDIAGDDGVVGVNDLLALLSMWGPCPGCIADLNGDDEVDIADLLALLAAWGPCA